MVCRAYVNNDVPQQFSIICMGAHRISPLHLSLPRNMGRSECLMFSLEFLQCGHKAIGSSGLRSKIILCFPHPSIGYARPMTLRPLRCSREITECNGRRSCDKSGGNVPAAATKIKKMENIGRGALFSGYNSSAFNWFNILFCVHKANKKTTRVARIRAAQTRALTWMPHPLH